MESVIGLVMSFVEKYPAIATVLMVMGGLRALLKPVMVGIQAYIDYTPKTSDDNLVKDIESNKIYKAVSFILDYAASIKLPVKK